MASTRVILGGAAPGSGFGTVEYVGEVAVVPSVAAAVEAALKASAASPAGDAVGVRARVTAGVTYYAQVLRVGDVGVALPAAAPAGVATVARVGTHFTRGGGETFFPEVAYHALGASPATDVTVAQGAGALRDTATGEVLYEGQFTSGVRHGKGKGLCYQRGGDGGVRFVGEYEGDWAHGQRQGHGVFVEDGGSRYDGYWYADCKYGSGTETLVGGGVLRGQWRNGRPHGVCVFVWPAGARSEYRQYDDGAVTATLPLPESTTVIIPRPASNLGAGGVGGVGMSRAHGSSSSLAGLVAGHVDHSGGHLGASPDFHPITIGGPGAGGESAFTLTAVPPGAAVGGGGVIVPAVTHPSQRINAGVLRFLRHSTVSDVAGGRAAGSGEIISVQVKDPVEACITKMTDNNVLSMPVFDPAADKFVAIIHMLDIFAFMLDLVAKKKATLSPAPSGLREMLAHQRRFASAPIGEVLEMSSHITPTAFRPLPAGAPLVYAAQTLSEGAHAVPVVDSAGKIVRMLTQADVIRFLAAHLDELGPMAAMSVGELGLGGHPEHLVVAHFGDKAFDVFAALRAKGAPAAPVVDSYGSIAANISFSDVKAIARKANFSALQLPLQQFFTSIDKGSEVMSPSIYVKASTLFSSVLLTLSATKIHQLYFVDDSLHPVGTVRIRDLLQLLVKEGGPVAAGGAGAA